MTSSDSSSGPGRPLGLALRARRESTPLTPIERVRDALATPVSPELAAAVDESERHARSIAAGTGDANESEALAALTFAGDALAAFAAEGELTTDDVHATAAALADVLGRPLESVRFALFSTVVSNSRLLEVPPVPAAGVQIRMALDLGLFRSISLWRRSVTGQPECVLQLGSEEVGRRTRLAARAVLRGRKSLQAVGRSSLRSAPIVRYGQVVGAVVAQSPHDDVDRDTAYLLVAAQAMGPVLEREVLLERSRSREQALVSSAERRLMRLAFDLHDGPIQDVLALGAEVAHLQRQLYPLVAESHRELAHGRFDDVTARLSELDRALREIAHSLESKSIVSRPLGEILHREVDAFTERTGIDAHLEIRGDPEALSSAQRVTLFRAIQEALSNVREHSGATNVEIRLRARRNSIDVRITDNGAGFEVGHALARAAKRGRLGVVGIGERVRMLGGTFELDSQPGGPTTLSLTLPRWQQEDE